jgi:deoxyhypusine synthase
LPDAVVCYVDATVAMPLIAHYALARRAPRKLKRLYDKRAKLVARLTDEYFRHNPELKRPDAAKTSQGLQ